MITAISSADLWFEQFMLSIRTPFFVQVFKVVTFFGNVTTLIGIAGIIALYVFLYNPQLRAYVYGLGTSLFGAAASSTVLKEIVQRARPSGAIPAIVDTSSSFPSWHATGAVAVYGFITFFLCRLFPRYTKSIVFVSVLLILSIGFSRLYLGVHFPSDVIAGYLVGGVWLLLGIAVTKRFAHNY